jgi:hypothetical protein
VADPKFFIDDGEQQLFLVPLLGDGNVGDLVELHAGRLKIGAAESDDIYLNLVGVAPSHVSLVYLGGHMTVLSAGHELRLDGVVQKQFPFDWNPLQVLTLGSAHLTYGPEDSAWPEVPEIEHEAEPEATAEPEVEEFVAPVKRTAKEHAVISARRGAIVFATAVGLIVIGLLANLLFGSRDIVSPNDLSIEKAYEEISQLLQSDKENFAAIKLEKRIDGALAISGFMEDQKSFLLLADSVRNQAIKTRGNVRFDALSKDKLSEQIKDLIGNYPLRHTMTISGNDIHVDITGVKTPDLDVANLKNELDRINDRITPRVFHHTIQTLDPNDLTKTINAQLASSPLTRNLKFELKNKTPAIRGIVAASAEEQTMQLVRQLTSTMMPRFPITVDITIDQKINFQVSSVVLGGAGAVANITLRGKTESFRVGEQVFGLGELVEIRKDGVVVSSRSKELFVPGKFNPS